MDNSFEVMENSLFRAATVHKFMIDRAVLACHRSNGSTCQWGRIQQEPGRVKFVLAEANHAYDAALMCKHKPIA